MILEHSDMEQEARQVALAPSEFLQGGRAGVRIKLEEQCGTFGGFSKEFCYFYKRIFDYVTIFQ